MRPINLFGIFWFIVPIIYYKSTCALIILINGILYHGMFTNKYLCIFDCFCNLLIGIYSTVYTKLPMNYVIIAWLIPLMFFINMLFFKIFKLYNRDICDLIHVLTVHIPMTILLILDNQNTRELQYEKI